MTGRKLMLHCSCPATLKISPTDHTTSPLTHRSLSPLLVMPSMQPYSGSACKLVFGIDVGTTFSGVAYTILDPGEVPKILGVTRYASKCRRKPLCPTNLNHIGSRGKNHLQVTRRFHPSCTTIRTELYTPPARKLPVQV